MAVVAREWHARVRYAAGTAAQSGLLPHPDGRGAVVIMVNVTVTPIEGGDRNGHHDHRREDAARTLHRRGACAMPAVGHFAAKMAGIGVKPESLCDRSPYCWDSQDRGDLNSSLSKRGVY
jgi:hypothetical protein